MRAKRLQLQNTPHSLCAYVVANVISLGWQKSWHSSKWRWVTPVICPKIGYLILFEFLKESVDSCDNYSYCRLTNVIKSIEEIFPRTSVSQWESKYFDKRKLCKGWLFFYWILQLVLIRKFAKSSSRCSRGEFFVDKLGWSFAWEAGLSTTSSF